MREWSKPASTLLFGFGIWIFCLCVYLSNLPLNYTYDGMVFASHIEREHLALWNFFHPHHLIYTFLGRLIFLWGKAHGATWDGLVTLQFFDIMTGTLGILIGFHLLVRETNDRPIALLSALGMAFSFSYWYFSTTPGVRIFATVTPLLTWYILTYLKKMPPIFGWLIGLAHGFAVLGHQTNLLLVPAFLGGILLLKEKSIWERLRAGLYYLMALIISTLGAYAFVGRYIYFRKTYADWLWWVFSYFHVSQWGGHLQAAGFERGKFAMMQSFLAKSLQYKPISEFFTFGSARIIFQYSLLVLLCLLLFRLKYYWNHYRQVVWVSVVWLLAFVPFFIWWEPWNIEFWVSSTVPCWILMGMMTSDLSRRFKNPILHYSNRYMVLGLWASLITLLFFYNFHGTITKVSVNAYGHKALLSALDWKVRADDLLVLDGINTIPFYIDRYQKRRYLSLHAFLKKYSEEPGKKDDFKNQRKKIGQATSALADPWNDLSGLFQKVWKHHRKVWVLTEAVDGDDGWRVRLETLLKLPEGQLRNFFTQYHLDPISYHGSVYFYEVVQPTPVPTPTATPTQERKVEKVNMKYGKH